MPGGAKRRPLHKAPYLLYFLSMAPQGFEGGQSDEARTEAMPPRRLRPRRVALIIEASRGYARGLVDGVAQYNRQHEGWSIYYTPRGLDDPPPAWLDAWQGEGILARINDARMARAVARKKVPVVDLRRAAEWADLPSIGPDDAAVSRLAAEHLRECGFRSFGFVGLPRGAHPAMDRRAEAFARCVNEAGLRLATVRVCGEGRGDFRSRQASRIESWLRKLPRPLGIMACNDDLALVALEACRRVGSLVPDEVAVLGVGNDPCLCNLGLPSLTSVDLDPQRIGYEAAALLERMMAGRHVENPFATVPPRGVVARASTDVLATADQDVVRATRFIRQRACGEIRVGDVLRAARMSRARLEPRVRQLLGRTVRQEIERVRIERCKQLLAGTSAPLKQIAVQVGYRYPEYMMRVFRRATGQTPGQFRRAAQGGGAAH